MVMRDVKFAVVKSLVIHFYSWYLYMIPNKRYNYYKTLVILMMAEITAMNSEKSGSICQ